MALKKTASGKVDKRREGDGSCYQHWRLRVPRHWKTLVYELIK